MVMLLSMTPMLTALAEPDGKELTESITAEQADDENDATFDIVAEVFEWGSAVTAVIVDAGEAVTQAQVDALVFSINAKSVSPATGATVYNGPRTITKVYPSAVKEKGKPGEGRYIVV
jgi:predicted peptidase